MGEIVISIPNRKSRRYILDDADSANILLKALEKSAIRVKGDASANSETEFAKDVKDVRKAVAEYKRTGKAYKWEDIKSELGL